MRAETLADRLGARRTATGWMARCPAHDDRQASLSIGDGVDGRLLLHCFAGCDLPAILAALNVEERDLFNGLTGRGGGGPSGGKRFEHSNSAGLTLAAYAAAKQLPEAFLATLDVSQITIAGRPGVRMLYRGRDGAEACVRFRCALRGDSRFRWKNGSKPCPYGLWRLDQRPPGAPLVLVEGESDAHTLWYHEIPALGLPGASSWQDAWAEYLHDVSEILVVIEPDAGGDAMRAWIGTSSVRDRVRLVCLDGVKDVSELYLQDPSAFLRHWQQALSAATTWKDHAAAAQQRQVTEAFALAQGLLEAPDLLDQVAAAIHADGYAGDPRPPLIAYLAFTSRVLERPLNVAFVAPSGAGKNRAVDAALAFVPSEAVHEVKAGTPRALIYSDIDLAHRYVVVAEADSLPEDGPAASAVRSLVTDSHFTYEVVEGNPKTGQHGTRRIEKAGPTGLITTGTKSLRTQLSTRTLEVPLRDDAAQTRAIMHAQARAVDGTPTHPPDRAPFLALQRWLDLAGERRVLVPFSGALAQLLSADAVRMRRDFPQLLTAIQAVALLRQRQRARVASGAIEATIEDYAVVRYLFGDVFDGIAAEGLTPAIRAAVDAIASDEEISETALATRLGIAKSTASYRVKRALARGWLTNVEMRKGCAAKLSRGEPLPEDTSVLPSPDRVREVFECSNQNPGVCPPPPPDGSAEESR